MEVASGFRECFVFPSSLNTRKVSLILALPSLLLSWFSQILSPAEFACENLLIPLWLYHMGIFLAVSPASVHLALHLLFALLAWLLSATYSFWTKALWLIIGPCSRKLSDHLAWCVWVDHSQPRSSSLFQAWAACVFSCACLSLWWLQATFCIACCLYVFVCKHKCVYHECLLSLWTLLLGWPNTRAFYLDIFLLYINFFWISQRI